MRWRALRPRVGARARRVLPRACAWAPLRACSLRDRIALAGRLVGFAGVGGGNDGAVAAAAFGAQARIAFFFAALAFDFGAGHEEGALVTEAAPRPVAERGGAY